MRYAFRCTPEKKKRNFLFQNTCCECVPLARNAAGERVETTCRENRKQQFVSPRDAKSSLSCPAPVYAVNYSYSFPAPVPNTNRVFIRTACLRIFPKHPTHQFPLPRTRFPSSLSSPTFFLIVVVPALGTAKSITLIFSATIRYTQIRSDIIIPSVLVTPHVRHSHFNSFRFYIHFPPPVRDAQ